MFNLPIFSQSSPVKEAQILDSNSFFRWLTFEQRGLGFCGASFLVSVPVFIQAPLVRVNPWLSLILTFAWLLWAYFLIKKPTTQLWGELLIGFSWSWFAGAIYWGWFRWEPLYHLPIEAIGLPVVLWCLSQRRWLVGNLFYLGSLFGTIVTDIYFYLTDLIPAWRQLMHSDPNLVKPIFQQALSQLQNPWAISWAVVLINILIGVGILGLQGQKNYWWTFAGAVLSTLFVDSLFWIAACLA